MSRRQVQSGQRVGLRPRGKCKRKEPTTQDATTQFLASVHLNSARTEQLSLVGSQLATFVQSVPCSMIRIATETRDPCCAGRLFVFVIGE